MEIVNPNRLMIDNILSIYQRRQTGGFPHYVSDKFLNFKGFITLLNM